MKSPRTAETVILTLDDEGAVVHTPYGDVGQLITTPGPVCECGGWGYSLEHCPPVMLVNPQTIARLSDDETTWTHICHQHMGGSWARTDADRSHLYISGRPCQCEPTWSAVWRLLPAAWWDTLDVPRLLGVWPD